MKKTHNGSNPQYPHHEYCGTSKGKLCFLTRTLAKRFGRKLAAKHSNTAGFTVYRCKGCGSYHLTTRAVAPEVVPHVRRR